MRVYKCPTCGIRWSRTVPFTKESCVARVSPTSVHLKDGTKVVIRYLGNFDTPQLEVVPQSVIKAQEPLGKHGWIEKHGHRVCFKCGIVRRADNKNKPCPGWIEVRTRVKPKRVRKTSVCPTCGKKKTDNEGYFNGPHFGFG